MTTIRRARSQRRLKSVALWTAAAFMGTWDSAATSGSGLFDSTSPLEIRIEAPWRSMTREMEAGRSADGHMIYKSDAGETTQLDVKLTIRGTSRLEVCDFPLLTLEMRPADIKDTRFAGQRVVHLTTQCRREIRFRDYLAREYLSYQAYRLLGDPALGVRMAHVEYFETDSQRPTRSALAFFLEDLDLAAARLGVLWLEPEAVETQMLNPETLARLGLFQYMLGNTDWSVLRGPPGEPCCHNVAILGPAGAETDLLPVPYDLDSTGLTNPPYAAPVESLPIRSVRQRNYRGFCASNSYLPEAIAQIRARRIELNSLFEDSSLLSASARRASVSYLDRFFEILESPKKLGRRIFDKCR